MPRAEPGRGGGGGGGGGGGAPRRRRGVSSRGGDDHPIVVRPIRVRGDGVRESLHRVGVVLGQAGGDVVAVEHGYLLRGCRPVRGVPAGGVGQAGAAV
ncbi:hypothetical protein, partial [Nocardia gipuzkoensis]|uniref:hypothetical protein n=1 Tax=Nocardia gipuzkoensis TaxID=2749991 RepID=UPI002458537B